MAKRRQKVWKVFRVRPGRKGTLKWLQYGDQGKVMWVAERQNAATFGNVDVVRMLRVLRSKRDMPDMVYNWQPV